MLPLIVCGIKHCGKSTLGRGVADALGIPFADTDEELEKEFCRRTGKTADCRMIFKEYGEAYFRKLEADTVRALSNHSGMVIALGGGVASNPYLSTEDLKKLGCWLYIEVAPQIAYKRILSRGLPPFLQNTGDPQLAFQELYDRRTPRFRELADIIYTVREELSIQEQTAELMKKLREELEV